MGGDFSLINDADLLSLVVDFITEIPDSVRILLSIGSIADQTVERVLIRPDGVFEYDLVSGWRVEASTLTGPLVIESLGRVQGRLVKDNGLQCVCYVDSPVAYGVVVSRLLLGSLVGKLQCKGCEFVVDDLLHVAESLSRVGVEVANIDYIGKFLSLFRSCR